MFEKNALSFEVLLNIIKFLSDIFLIFQYANDNW